MLKSKDGNFFVTDQLRNRNTIEFLGIWEELHNPNFNYGKFAIIKSKAGLNSYKISVKEWVEKAKTNGILEIINQNLENVNLLLFIFDAKLVKENIQSDGEEISV